MVGRMVVGKPGGRGAMAFDYFRGRPGTENWKAVPPAAQKACPSVDAIMRLESCGERAARRKSLSYRPKCLTLDSLLATLSATRFRPPSSGLTTLDVEEAI